MSQHDFNITTADANTGVTVRAAINAALQALASCSSGATEPATPYPGQLWLDTSGGVPSLKIRDTTNAYWLVIAGINEDNFILARSWGYATFGAQTTNISALSSLALSSNNTATLSALTTLTIGDATGKIVFSTKSAPVSASDTGTAGEIRIDANYIYICTAANTWKRATLSTW